MQQVSPRRDSWRQREETVDVEDTRSCFCLRRAGIIPGIVRRPGLPDFVRRYPAWDIGRDAGGGRLRDRLSPRPVRRLPAEWGRRRCAGAPGSGAARRHSTARGRSARRLWGGIALASKVPALRRPVIAATRRIASFRQHRAANAAASWVRLPRNLRVRQSARAALAVPWTRSPRARTATRLLRHIRQGSIKAKLNRETTRRSSTERRSAYSG